MKIFLYCSYTNSKRGFCLTCLEGDRLVSKLLYDSQDTGEQMVDRFFAYDNFRILWQEFPANEQIPIVFRPAGGIFGVRGLKGKISDRDGVVNFALLAGAEETGQLQAAAEKILKDLSGFSASLFRCLTIGGSCGYQAEGDTLRTLFENLWEEGPSPAEESRRVVRTSRDLLRFAVYIGDWEQASAHLVPGWLWKICPKQAVSEAEFQENNGFRL